MKILYTFDEDKTNCLARWPHPVDIRTAYLDQDTPVGVIELKTCLQAIATASPEIVAGLGQDYTVYAYDYSEYETPLVGQGMLSWILASASPTPGAPASQSRTMVTGRVSRGGMGLFSGSSQETLEVKLRLVPVPTSRQSEYLESMKKYRDFSQMMPPSFDPQVWTSFLQQNPGFIQQATQSRSQSPTVASGQAGGYGIEHVQRLLNGDSGLQNQLNQPPSRGNNFATAGTGQQLPRLPSPASSIASTATAPKKRGRKPGPNYRGPKARRGKQESIPESTDPGYGTGDERLEDGLSKKRAKVVQADWDGKQDLGKQAESLRVAASTAASVRIHQPTAVRPGSNSHLTLENQPRAPTPIADPSQGQRRPRLPVTRSNLGRHSLLNEISPTTTFRHGAASDRAPDSSPEKSTADNSPLEIASSPPIFPANSTAQSSPRLPEFTRPFEDSGFMSGTFDDLFEDDELRPLDEHDYAVAAQYSKRLDLPAYPRHDGDEQDSTFLEELPLHQSEEDVNEASMQATTSTPESRPLDWTFSSDKLPAVPASDPGRPSKLTRSQTWSADVSVHPTSDAITLQTTDSAPQRPKSSGRARRQSDMGGQSGVKRKAVIQSKLASSIAAGEVPPFCDNCGAIETPTWRKAWSKIHSGTPEHVRLSEEEGGILAWQTLQTDNKGMICLYRIIKKTLARDDQGFTEMLLCNRWSPFLVGGITVDTFIACGIHLISRKCMRPKEMWTKGQKGPDDKSKRRSSDRKTETNPFSGDAGTSSTGVFSEPSSPAKAPGQSDAVNSEPQLPVLKRALPTAEKFSFKKISPLDEASAAAALERAIKSSPHKFMGTQEVPIEVEDLTPQPTQRILFPSPKQPEKPPSKQRSISGGSSPLPEHTSGRNSLADIPTLLNKENCPPPATNDIDRFFNEDAYAAPDRSTTSPPRKSKYPCLNRTPKKSPGHRPLTTSESLSAAKAFLRPPNTPKRTPAKHTGPLAELTPFTAHLNQLLSDANAATPGASQLDFPMLPSLRNTPNSSRILDFDFGNFDSQDLISTDIPMPSSPPPWNFESFDDSAVGGHGSLWGDCTLPNTVASPQGSERLRQEADQEQKCDDNEKATIQVTAETMA